MFEKFKLTWEHCKSQQWKCGNRCGTVTIINRWVCWWRNEVVKYNDVYWAVTVMFFIYSVSQKNIPLTGPWVFFIFFRRLIIFKQNCMFIFVQKYKILFNNHECLLCDDKQRVKTHTICQIFSQTANRIYSKYFHIKLISYVQNVEHRPRRMHSDVCESR